MKKYFNYLAIILVALILHSCDYIANPYEAHSVPAPIDTTGNDTTNHDTTVIVTHIRRVLVEDYTGHKCTACPQAAIVADELKQTYGEKVVVVGVHAGFFAVPSQSGLSSPPPGSYLTDFRTTAGDAYNSSTYFGISAVGNPNGMINRKDYTPTTTDHIKAHTTWNSEVAGLLALPPVADLTVTNTYNSSTRSVSIHLVSEFLDSTLTSGNYKQVVMITQDSIIDWQLDAGVHIENYVHKHVLRDNVNGTWGETLVSGAITTNAKIIRDYTYILPAAYKGNTCDENHCHVVAFIYNVDNYEVIQAAEAKVKP
jgi:thiol-disulfide isomerase/thioredoxin